MNLPKKKYVHGKDMENNPHLGNHPILDSEGMKQLADEMEKRATIFTKSLKSDIRYVMITERTFNQLIKFLRGD